MGLRKLFIVDFFLELIGQVFGQQCANLMLKSENLTIQLTILFNESAPVFTVHDLRITLLNVLLFFHL